MKSFNVVGGACAKAINMTCPVDPAGGCGFRSSSIAPMGSGAPPADRHRTLWSKQGLLFGCNRQQSDRQTSDELSVWLKTLVERQCMPLHKGSPPAPCAIPERLPRLAGQLCGGCVPPGVVVFRLEKVPSDGNDRIEICRQSRFGYDLVNYFLD